jgi:hypothetical protein
MEEKPMRLGCVKPVLAVILIMLVFIDRENSVWWSTPLKFVVGGICLYILYLDIKAKQAQPKQTQATLSRDLESVLNQPMRRLETCNHCRGRGFVSVEYVDGYRGRDGMSGQYIPHVVKKKIPCPTCEGTGQT